MEDPYRAEFQTKYDSLFELDRFPSIQQLTVGNGRSDAEQNVENRNKNFHFHI